MTRRGRLIPVGSLVVDLVDAGSRRLVWRGMASETLASNPEKSEKRINKVVTGSVLNIQPIYPVSLKNGATLINRMILPLPKSVPGVDRETGLGPRRQLLFPFSDNYNSPSGCLTSSSESCP